MRRSQIDSVALIGAVLAAAVGLTLLPGPFIWLASIGGLILLFVLFGYDEEGYRSIFQSLGFAAVCGFCLMLASAIIFKLRAGGQIAASDPQIAGIWLPLTCAFGTVLFWAIDRARMSGRSEVAPRQSPHARATYRGFIPEVAATAPAPSAAPSSRPVRTEPVPAEPVIPQPAPAAPDQPIISPAATAEPLHPGPTPIIPTGKETMIYINLVGEGLNLLRSVRAEHLGRDFYKIVEPVPEGESWEYQPGQVVRCKKKNLSTGKALVAFEEAPRAN